MRFSFIILFMIDLIQRQPCVCMRAYVCKLFFKKKNFSSETIDWSFTKCSLYRGYKLLFTVTEKSGLWSDTGAQAPLVIDGGSKY